MTDNNQTYIEQKLRFAPLLTKVGNPAVHCGLGLYSKDSWKKIGDKIMCCIKNCIQGLQHRSEGSVDPARYSSFGEVYAWYQSTQTYESKQICQQEHFFNEFSEEMARRWFASMSSVQNYCNNAKKLYKLLTALETVLVHCPHILSNPKAYAHFPQLVLEAFRDSSKRYQFLDELSHEDRLRWDIYIRAWYLGAHFSMGCTLGIKVYGPFIPAFCEDYLGVHQVLNCVQNLINDKCNQLRWSKD